MKELLQITTKNMVITQFISRDITEISCVTDDRAEMSTYHNSLLYSLAIHRHQNSSSFSDDTDDIFQVLHSLCILDKVLFLS